MALKMFWLLMGETFFSIYLRRRSEHTHPHARDWLRYASQFKKFCNAGKMFVFSHSDYRSFVSIRNQAKSFILENKNQHVMKTNSVHRVFSGERLRELTMRQMMFRIPSQTAALMAGLLGLP